MSWQSQNSEREYPTEHALGVEIFKNVYFLYTRRSCGLEVIWTSPQLMLVHKKYVFERLRAVTSRFGCWTRRSPGLVLTVVRPSSLVQAFVNWMLHTAVLFSRIQIVTQKSCIYIPKNGKTLKNIPKSGYYYVNKNIDFFCGCFWVLFRDINTYFFVTIYIQEMKPPIVF